MANLRKNDFLGLSDHEPEEGKASPSLFKNDFLQNTNYDQMENDFNQSIDSFFLNQIKAEAGTSSHNQQNRSILFPIPKSAATIDKVRKRENDKRYREKQKQGQKAMKTNLELLEDENDKLKTENDNLKQDNLLMNEILKSQTKEIDQFKTEFEKMKYAYNKQNALVQRLSELLAASPDLQLENQRLVFENAQLRHNASQDHRISQYAEENARLKLENRVLNVQKDALCGKLITDNQ